MKNHCAKDFTLGTGEIPGGWVSGYFAENIKGVITAKKNKYTLLVH